MSSDQKCQEWIIHIRVFLWASWSIRLKTVNENGRKWEKVRSLISHSLFINWCNPFRNEISWQSWGRSHCHCLSTKLSWCWSWTSLAHIVIFSVAPWPYLRRWLIQGHFHQPLKLWLHPPLCDRFTSLLTSAGSFSGSWWDHVVTLLYPDICCLNDFEVLLRVPQAY